MLTAMSCSPTISQNDEISLKVSSTSLLEITHLESIVDKADSLLKIKPVTITSYPALRSQGGLNDYYSEGSYWWPDPTCASCPYIRKDGERNPENFKYHKLAIREFSESVSTLTSSYLLTHDVQYAEKAIAHLEAWFVTPETRMNPSLLYSQAIKGICSGRGIGVIDAVTLIHVALSTQYLIEENLLKGNLLTGVKSWFNEFSDWLSSHSYGIDEKNNNNNHSTWWGAQLSAYANVADRPDLIILCQAEFKKQLEIQMAEDGSFPRELSRTRPFHYMNYNLRAWTSFALLASTDSINLWGYQSENGSLEKAINFAKHYYKNPSLWQHTTAVEQSAQPKANDFLIFAFWGLEDTECKTIWADLMKASGPLKDKLSYILLWENKFRRE